MAVAHVDLDAIVEATGVDPKTVHRWINGRIECRHVQWPRCRRLKWRHLASVVVGLDLA
jgi:hypothetical protein